MLAGPPRQQWMEKLQNRLALTVACYDYVSVNNREQWKQVVTKMKKGGGEAYVSGTKKTGPGKLAGPPCTYS